MPDNPLNSQPPEVVSAASIDQVKALVLDALSSPNSRRAYDRALTDFLAWYDAQGRPGFTKATVNRYKTYLDNETKLAPSTINQRLSAIRKLAQEAADNGLIDPVLAAGIAKVKGVTTGGRRVGNWLSLENAQRLLDEPDPRTTIGMRDRAVLAVLLGSGLRREEAANLTFEHVQQRDGRWCIVDIEGKRNKVRTVPIPNWVKVAIDEWGQESGLTGGRVFRAVNKGGRVWGDGITPQAVWHVVSVYSQGLGLNVSPHDLRRTFAKLAHQGGSEIDQIQLSLGHKSIQTTERYLGVEQDLTDAPADHLGLRLG